MRALIAAGFATAILLAATEAAKASPTGSPMNGGVPLQQTGPPPEPSIVFLVDQSGSLSPADVAREQEAVEYLAVNDAATNARVAVVGFGSSNGTGQNAVDALCPAAPLSDPPSRQRVVDCSGRLRQRTAAEGNDTDHVAALKAALEQLSGAEGPGIVFLLTDGKLDVGNSPQYGPDPASRTNEAQRQLAEEVLPKAKAAGVQVWPIGFGQIDGPALDRLAAGGAGPNPACAKSSQPRPVVAVDSATVSNQFLEVLGGARCNRTSSTPPGVVEAGGTTDLVVEIPKIASGGTISVLRGDPRISVTYIDPKDREVPLNGTLDESSFSHTTGDAVDGLRITDPVPGKWKARLTAPLGVAAPLVQASITWKGALRTAIDVRPLVPAPGDEVNVRVRLQTRRGVTIDPGQVADLTFGLSVTGEGFEPIRLPLAIDPKETTVAAGRFTLPKETNGNVDVIGEVDGLGVETDRRPYSFRTGPGQVRFELAISEERRISLRRGGTASVTLTSLSDRPRSLRVVSRAADDRTTVEVSPPEVSVPVGPGKQTLQLTVKGSAFGQQSIDLVFVDSAGSPEIGSFPVTFTVERDPSGLSKVMPWLLGLLGVAGLGALAAIIGRRALAPPPASGLVAHLVDPAGSTVDSYETPHGRCDAPPGKQQQFAFIVESTEYTTALISAPPSQQDAIVVGRTRSGQVRIAQPGQPADVGQLGQVVPLTGQTGFGLVVVGSGEQPGPYPGWQQRQPTAPEGKDPPMDPAAQGVDTTPVPTVVQSDDLL